MSTSDPRSALGLPRLINCTGNLTPYGASLGTEEAGAVMAALLALPVRIDDLQRRASQIIAEITGAEAGCVTASVSSAITLGVAAAMAGNDLARILQLPDSTGLKHEVVIQTGHLVNYGAPVEQGIRLAGATVVPVGQVTDVEPAQLEAAVTARTAAAVYVVSHHCAPYGMIPFPAFVEICHARGVPVLVDLAAERDLRGYIAAGADLTMHSAHKFPRGPTAGIVAGSKDLVRAFYRQNQGIGRGMKVGKESIAGALVAMQAYVARDHEAVRAAERRSLLLWQERFNSQPGLHAEIVPDATGNPVDRLRLEIAPQAAGLAAWELAWHLRAGERPIAVREHQIEHGHVVLDPVSVRDGEAEEVADAIDALLVQGRAGTVPRLSLSDFRRRVAAATAAWPDLPGTVPA